MRSNNRTLNLIKKFALINTVIAAPFYNAYSVNLEEALAYSYANKESFKIIQQDFYKNIEAFAIAVSEIAPIIQTTSVVSRKDTVDPEDTAVDNVNSTRRGALGVGIVVTQPLFNFGSGTAGIKAAQHASQAFIASYYTNEQKEILEAVKAYLNLIEAKQAYEVAQTSTKSYEVILASENAKFRLGQSSMVDVSKVEASLASAQYQESRALVDYESAKGDFTIFFGDLDPENISWPEVDLGFAKGSSDKFKERVMSRNYEITASKYDVLSKRASYKSNVAKLLPSASLVARTDAGYSLSKAKDPQTSYSVSVEVNAPILNLKSNAKVRASKMDARSSAYGYDQVIKNAEKNVTKLWETYNSAKTSLNAAAKAVEASLIAFEGVSNQYSLGEKGLTDVLIAEQDLLKAKTQNISVRKNYLLTLYNMKSMMGDLTARGLGLKVKYFRPEMEYKKSKAGVLGF